jgi:hypothetical protein
MPARYTLHRLYDQRAKLTKQSPGDGLIDRPKNNFSPRRQGRQVMNARQVRAIARQLTKALTKEYLLHGLAGFAPWRETIQGGGG